MKKIFKYSLLLLAVGMVFTACKDDDSAGKLDPVVLSGPQTYFNNEMADVIEISKEESSFTVTINRQNSVGEAIVPITATMPEGSIFTVPATVTFPDGATSADIVITYDPNKLEYGNYTEITLAIGDESATSPYGLSTYTFSAGVTAWVSVGRGLYREDLISPLYKLDMVTYEVEIEKNIIEEGMYRIKNPYGADFPYNEPGDWDTSKDYYMVIDATDPDYVYFTTCETGVNWGDGDIIVSSFVQYYLDNGVSLAAVKAKNPQFFGTLQEGVITMPEPKTALLGFDGDYAQYYANGHGGFAVALPGYKIADYSIEYEMSGRFIDAANNLYVEGTATLGEDVASAVAVLVTEDNYLEIYQAIISGQEVEGMVEIESGETFRLPFTESGTYYVMILAFDKNGDVVQDSFSRVKLDNPSEGSSINWEAEYSGSYMYDLFSEPGDPDIQEGMILSVDAENPNHMMLAPWMDESHQLEFTVVDANGTIVVPEQGTGFNYDGELFVMDVATYTDGDPEYADKVCKFAGNTITLSLAYYNENHVLFATDTYTITGEPEVKQKLKQTSSRKLTKKEDFKKTYSLRPFKKFSKPILKKRG